jgi:hypothetical protein
MARHENNRTRSYPYGYNLHRNYGVSDYEAKEITSNKFPYDEDRGPKRDYDRTWGRIDEQKGDRHFSRRDDNDYDYSGYYGDANAREHLGDNRFGSGGINDNSYLKNFSGKGPRGWQRSDERIREDVCEALYESPYVDASDIEVTVKDKNVLLQGSVNDRSMKWEAEECIDHIVGIQDIQNQLQIKNLS